MTNQNLVRDITDPANQLVSYGSQQIGFYDGFKPGKIDPRTGELTSSENHELYIYINNGNDKFTVVRRKVKEIRVGNRFIKEEEAYARAYQKYLNLKNQSAASTVIDSEKEALMARIAELEAKAKTKAKTKTKKIAENKEEDK